MELLYNSTRRFEKEMKRLDGKDRDHVVKAVNAYGQAMLVDPSCRYPHIHRLHIPVLKNGLESTLYTLRVGRDLRVILTADEDPLFDQIVIALLSVTRHDQMDRVYRSIAESLYQEQLESLRAAEVHHG